MKKDEEEKCWAAFELLENRIYGIDYKNNYDIEKDQPKHVTYGSIDIDFKAFRTDTYFGFGYADEIEMQKKLVDFVNRVFTPDFLNNYRTGLIKNISITIGPEAISGVNINDEDGISTFTYA